jgi:nucleoside-diphosphate-sugar epimerase
MNILVTGSTGFIGRRLCSRLAAEGYLLRCAVRSLAQVQADDRICVGDIGPETRWKEGLSGIDAVVHTAAGTHVMAEQAVDPLDEYRRINVHGTLNLARQAAEAGVRRFVFLSSIKVNGERTLPDSPFTPDDVPAPEDSYGKSKLEAEQGLQQLAQQTGMDVVIIRPPLVYGPGVKGNFARMMRLVEKGVPLPLGAVRNQRSLVGLDNLVDLIVTCIDHPEAANQIFLAGDGEDVSTPELLRGLAKAMDKPARLIPLPAGVLMFGATLLGKRAVAQRLLGSLQVDISKTREMLGWEPLISVETALKEAVRGRRLAQKGHD